MRNLSCPHLWFEVTRGKRKLKILQRSVQLPDSDSMPPEASAETTPLDRVIWFQDMSLWIFLSLK